MFTLAALLLEPYLPAQRKQVYPAPGVTLWPFTSASDPAKVSFEWLDEARGLFRCASQGELSYVVCGVSMNLAGDEGGEVDLSGYQSVRVYLEYRGESPKVRLSMRDRTQGLLSPDTPVERQKYLRVQVKPEEIRGGGKISLTEFSVADWWLDQFDVPRQYARPTLHNATVFGVDVSTVGEHEIRLDAVVLEKPWFNRLSLLYTLFAGWALLLSFEATSRYFGLKRLAKEREDRLNTMVRSYRNLIRVQAQLAQESITDPLTGVLNRKGLEDVCQRLFAPGETNEGAMLLIDLDHFKEVNDNYGHDCGDRVLQTLAHLLQLNTREGDVLARWGGEEFVLLCPGLQLDQAKSLAAKICTLLALTVVDEELGLIVTTSIGNATVQPGEDFARLFKRADIGLYQAKSTGRNRWCVCPEDYDKLLRSQS